MPSKTRHSQSDTDYSNNIENDPFELGASMKATAQVLHNAGDKIYDSIKTVGEKAYSMSKDVVEDNIKPQLKDYKHKAADVADNLRERVADVSAEAEHTVHHAYEQGNKLWSRTLTRMSHFVHNSTSMLHHPLFSVMLTLGLLWAGAWMNSEQRLVESYGPEGLKIIDSRLYALPKTIHQVIGNLGTIGRSKYTWFLQVDFLFGLLAATWLSVMLAHVSSTKELLLFPLFELGFDLIENVTLLRLLSIYPSRSLVAEFVLMLSVSLKWAFIISSLALIAIGVASKFAYYIQGHGVAFQNSSPSRGRLSHNFVQKKHHSKSK